MPVSLRIRLYVITVKTYNFSFLRAASTRSAKGNGQLNASWHLHLKKSPPGFVIVDVGNSDDLLLKGVLTDRIKCLSNQNNHEMNTRIYMKKDHILRCYRNLSAVFSGNVPPEKVLSIRVSECKKLKLLLKLIRRNPTSSDLSDAIQQIKFLLPSIFEDSCERILYAAVVRGHLSRMTPKLLVIAAPFPDPLRLRIFRTESIIPDFVSECIRLFYKGNILISLCKMSSEELGTKRDDVKKTLSNDKWLMISQLLFSERFTLISTPEWEAIDSNVVSHLHKSQSYMKVVTDNLLLLALDNSNPRDWHLSAITCLCIVKKSLSELLLKDDHLIKEVDELMLMVCGVKSCQTSTSYPIQVKLLKLADYLDNYLCKAFAAEDRQPVDTILDYWRMCSCFENNFACNNSSKSFLNGNLKTLSTDKRFRIDSKCAIHKDLSTYSQCTISKFDELKVKALLDKLGHPVNKIHPDNILCISKFGSHLYNLDVQESDTDYYIIFRQPANANIDESCDEIYICRDNVRRIDWRVIEARLFAQMLYHSSTVMSELIFSPNQAEYLHSLVKILSMNWHIFLTEQLYISYRSYARNILRAINFDIQTEHNNKCLYQAYHKIFILESLSSGLKPQVRVRGKDRRFIRSLRLAKTFEKDELKELVDSARERIDKISNERTAHFSQYSDHNSLRAWLTLVRLTASY